MSMYGFNPFLYTMGQSASLSGLPSTATPKQSADDPFAFSSMPGFFNAPVAPTVTAPMSSAGTAGLNLSGGLPIASANASTPLLTQNLTTPSTGTSSGTSTPGSFSAADLSKMGVTSSVLTCMSQVNSMVSNVCQGLGPFVANIVNNPQNQPGASNGTSGNFVGGNYANVTDAQNKIADAAASSVGKSMWSGLLGSGGLGCAASVSNVLNQAGVLKYKMNAINVNTEADQLEKNGFVKLKPGEKPQPGDVWIGKGGVSDGHTGIVGPNGVEYDNHSSTGKWSKESGNYFSKWTTNVYYRKVS